MCVLVNDRLTLRNESKFPEILFFFGWKHRSKKRASIALKLSDL